MLVIQINGLFKGTQQETNTWAKCHRNDQNRLYLGIHAGT